MLIVHVSTSAAFNRKIVRDWYITELGILSLACQEIISAAVHTKSHQMRPDSILPTHIGYCLDPAVDLALEVEVPFRFSRLFRLNEMAKEIREAIAIVLPGVTSLVVVKLVMGGWSFDNPSSSTGSVDMSMPAAIERFWQKRNTPPGHL